MTVKNIKKAIIFCGGKGTRMSELTEDVPKPLVTIGPNPLVLWVMKTLYRQGVKEFYLLLGYKSESFKRFFKDYVLRGRNMIVTKEGYQLSGPPDDAEDWVVHLIETGEDTTTGGRLAYMKDAFNPGEQFWLTYGDSLSDVDLEMVEKLHNMKIDHDKQPIVTLTAIQRAERFGALKVDKNGKVLQFSEKIADPEDRINGGYIACSYDIFNYVDKNSGDFSKEILSKIADKGLQRAYIHDGFWAACDSKRDRDNLNQLYSDHPELFG